VNSSLPKNFLKIVTLAAKGVGPQNPSPSFSHTSYMTLKRISDWSVVNPLQSNICICHLFDGNLGELGAFLQTYMYGQFRRQKVWFSKTSSPERVKCLYFENYRRKILNMLSLVHHGILRKTDVFCLDNCPKGFRAPLQGHGFYMYMTY
jgi:hypothetical protein